MDLIDGDRIRGSRETTLVLHAVEPEDAGAYTVAISNAVASVVSEPAQLMVNPPPHFTTQPADHTVAAGTLNIALVATAAGPGVISYQWHKDGRAIPRATRPFYILPVARAEDAGTYTVTARNAFGATTSAAATLVVNPRP